MQKRSKICLTESCQTKVALILQNSNKLRVNVPNSKNTRIDLYCRSSYAGNYELVKSIVGTKFRRSHVCLHPQAGNRLGQLMVLLKL